MSTPGLAIIFLSHNSQTMARAEPQTSAVGFTGVMNIRFCYTFKASVLASIRFHAVRLFGHHRVLQVP